MNEEEEEEAESDRTLIAQDEETENVSPEYRMATLTPSANTKQVVEEIQEDDDEATMADPTLMTLVQTPLPDPQVLKDQQQTNMKRLMEKIERQRQAAQHRLTQQQALVTPSHKTPQRLVVSPGYGESASSSGEERSVIQEQSISSSASSNVEIEERRLQLEFVVFPGECRERERPREVCSGVENKFWKNRFVSCPNERISRSQSVVHPCPISRSKAFFAIFVPAVRRHRFLRARRHSWPRLIISTVTTNRKKTFFKLFKRLSLRKNLNFPHRPRRASPWKMTTNARVRINEDRDFNSTDTRVIRQKIEIIHWKISSPGYSRLNNKRRRQCRDIQVSQRFLTVDTSLVDCLV